MSLGSVYSTTDLTISIRFAIAAGNQEIAGAFFLARCESGDALSRSWETYLRRPLFPVQIERAPDATTVAFHLPDADDPGYTWLRERIPGETVDLIGPFGKGFTLENAKPNLLLIADAAMAPLLFPLLDGALDRGGRVTLLVRYGEEGGETVQEMLARLPLAVEARAETTATFAETLVKLLPWCDQMCAVFPPADYPALARAVRNARLRPLPRFAQALVLTEFPCGVGACLACVTPHARGGHTRACVHGPVFDLLELG